MKKSKNYQSLYNTFFIFYYLPISIVSFWSGNLFFAYKIDLIITSLLHVFEILTLIANDPCIFMLTVHFSRFKVIDEFTMLETTLDDLDGGSLYSVQVQSIDGNEKIVVSTVKTVLTQNQGKFANVDV